LELRLPQPGRPRSPPLRALAKAASKHTPVALPVRSFGSLLADLTTSCLTPSPPPCPASGSSPPRPVPAPNPRPARCQPPPRGRV